MWAGVKMKELEIVLDRIKFDCPSCITFINEGRPETVLLG